MAVEVRTFTISVPKGGTPAAPQKFAMSMPVRLVDGVEIYVPAGNKGQMQFALGVGGTAVLPTNAGAYILAEDEVIHWPLEHQIDSGAWQLLAYNTGNSPHLIHIRFLLTPPGMDKPPVGTGWIDSLTIEFPGSGGGSSGSGGGGGTPSFSFAIQRPLAVLSAAQGGSSTIPLLFDEVGTRPGNYAVAFSDVPAGISLNAIVGSSPTALTIAATVSQSVAVGSYNATVTVSNGGVVNSATLTITVTATVPGGGGKASAAVSAGPSTLALGDVLFVSGTGWAPLESVVVSLNTQAVSVQAGGDGTWSARIVVGSSVTPGVWFVTANSATHYATGPQITVTSGAGGDSGVLFIPIDGGNHTVPAEKALALVSLGGYRGLHYYVYDLYGGKVGEVSADASGNLYWPNAAGTAMYKGSTTALQFCTTANPGGANCIRVSVTAT